MNKLYLVRHGKTSWNDKHLIQGRQNIPLNNLGYKQVEILSRKRIFKDIDICFSSPLLRARETARILVRDRLDIIIDDRLIEREFGMYEGKSLDLKKHFDIWNDISKNIDTYGIEPVVECIERAKSFIDMISRLYDNKKILIVSHGAIMRALHYVITDDDVYINHRLFIPQNATIYEYDL